MTRIHAALLAITLAAPAWAQGGPSALHAAWLRETLDLDLGGATQAYLALARDPNAPMVERQVAAARLEELRRIGAPAVGEDTATEVLPEALRDAVVENAVRAMREAVAAVLAAAAKPAQAGTAAQPALPTLRPLVQFVVQALREPSRSDRSAPSRFLPTGSADQARILERIRASEIARAELAGRAEEADATRRRAFPTWKAQPWPHDKTAAWSTVRGNLVRWQQERQISGAEREILDQLLATLDADAKESPELALARLDRLPVYAERLRAGLATDR